MLPAPLLPTRLKPLGTDVALRQLGFDAEFDVALQCKVDSITAVDDLAQTCSCGEPFQDGDVFCRKCSADRYQVQRGRRLLVMLSRFEACRRRLSLPCACVILSKALRREEDAKSKKGQTESKNPEDLTPEEAKMDLANKVAAAAGMDVMGVVVEEVGDRLQCSVQISHQGTSAFGLRDVLAAATKDKGGGLERGDASGIHRAFAVCGSVEDLNLTVSVAWARDRVMEEVALIHPGYLLEEARLNEIMQAAAESRSLYDAVWKEIAHEEKEAVAVLMSQNSLARFVGAGQPEILSLEDGWNAGLVEEAPKQDATRLNQLIESAATAHRALKEALAPNTEWSQDVLNDMIEVPYEDERRRITRPAESPWELAPGATLIDLGLKAEGRIFEKAKWRQRPEQIAPPLTETLDISRILIIFSSCQELCDGLERIKQHMDVVSLENRFSNPLCMGHRCVILTVRQSLEVEHDGTHRPETHYSKLILEHREVFGVKEGSGAPYFAQVFSLLQGIGIASREVSNLRRIVLRELGCTKAQVLQVQEQELYRAFACARDAESLPQSDNTALAQRIKDEATQQALAAGVPQMRVIAATARASAAASGQHS